MRQTSTPYQGEDFCLTHGQEHMRSTMGNPVPWCEACEQDREIQNVGNEQPISDESTQDIRWAVNVLLEKIAAKFEANETMDIWRSDAAALVRSFKHDLAAS